MLPPLRLIDFETAQVKQLRLVEPVLFLVQQAQVVQRDGPLPAVLFWGDFLNLQGAQQERFGLVKVLLLKVQQPQVVEENAGDRILAPVNFFGQGNGFLILLDGCGIVALLLEFFPAEVSGVQRLLVRILGRGRLRRPWEKKAQQHQEGKQPCPR